MTLRTEPALAAGSAAHFYKCLATSTGNIDMTVAGHASTAPGVFFATPSTANAPSGLVITRITLSIVDAGIRPERFAGLSASTAGLKIQVTTSTGGVLFDFLDGQTIKKNADWSLLAGADAVTTTPSAGDDGFAVRWTIKRTQPLLVKQGQQFRFTIQDASSGISSWNTMAQGYYEVDRTL